MPEMTDRRHRRFSRPGPVPPSLPTAQLEGELALATADLTAAINAKAAAEARQSEICDLILRQVAGLRAETEALHDPRFLAVLRHLYWHFPQVPSRKLATAAGFLRADEMLQALGPIKSGVICGRCGEDIPRTSRSWTPNVLDGLELCGSCRPIRMRETGRWP